MMSMILEHTWKESVTYRHALLGVLFRWATHLDGHVQIRLNPSACLIIITILLVSSLKKKCYTIPEDLSPAGVVTFLSHA